ncbi:MAG: hypothetical protein WA746_00860 [Isosphaeraceae bacterium]
MPIVPDVPQCRLASGQPSHSDIVHLGRGVQQQPRRHALVHDNTLPDFHLEPFDAAKTRDLHNG